MSYLKYLFQQTENAISNCLDVSGFPMPTHSKVPFTQTFRSPLHSLKTLRKSQNTYIYREHKQITFKLTRNNANFYQL